VSALAVGWAFKAQERLSELGHPLPATAHHVLLALADRYNARHEKAWPSYADICSRTGLSERAVRNAISVLEGDRGWPRLISREARISPRGRKVGYDYRFPSFDVEAVQERAAADFPLGRYDEDIARENRAEDGGWYDRPF
jgi:hypothetical protein